MVRTIGVSSAKAAARTHRTPPSDASTAATALSESASAVGTATGIANGTGSTVESARGTRSETGSAGTAIAIATGNETATATVTAVIATDETKRIAIGRAAGRSARSVVERCSPRRTAGSLLVRDIVLPRLPMRRSGSEEDSARMTYVSTSRPISI